MVRKERSGGLTTSCQQNVEKSFSDQKYYNELSTVREPHELMKLIYEKKMFLRFYRFVLLVFLEKLYYNY